MVALADGRHTSIDPLSLETDDRRRDIIAQQHPRSGRLEGPRRPAVVRHRSGRADDRSRPAARERRAPADPHRRGHWPTRRPLRRGVPNVRRPGPGNMAFRFSAVTLLEPHKSRHRYRLEGFDRGLGRRRRRAGWPTTPTSRPGRYRFRVQGSNADGVWNEAGDAIELRLRPTSTDAPGSTACRRWRLGAALVLLWRQRVRGLRRDYLAALAERSRVARELHDTLLQGMSAARHAAARPAPAAGARTPAAARELAAIDNMVVTALQETRAVPRRICAARAASGDLAVALERLADRMTEGRAMPARWRSRARPRPCPTRSREICSASPRRRFTMPSSTPSPGASTCSCTTSPRWPALTVADDGCGFEQATARGRGRRTLRSGRHARAGPGWASSA